MNNDSVDERHTVRMVRSDRLVMAAENSPCDAMAVVMAYVYFSRCIANGCFYCRLDQRVAMKRIYYQCLLDGVLMEGG